MDSPTDAEAVTAYPVTADSLRIAYGNLIDAIASAHMAVCDLAAAERDLKEDDAQVWPGANETERKASKLIATAGKREAVFQLEMFAKAAENALAIRKLELDEQKTLLRLMEVGLMQRQQDYDEDHRAAVRGLREKFEAEAARDLAASEPIDKQV